MKIHTAIVAEGGGQRGIYTAGVLDAFQETRFNPFGLGCGVSAGAQNLLAYFLKQQGYAQRAIAELTTRADFLVPYRWMASRSMLDLDEYFERTVRDTEYRLPYQQLSSLNANRRLVFVATERETLSALYLEPDESTVVNYLKASSAVPFLYKSGVPLGDRLLVDGGVADPLPVKFAYEQGARRILLIRTLPFEPANTSAFVDDLIWRRALEKTRRFSSAPFKMIQMLERHEQKLHEASCFVHEPPADLELVTVSPEKALSSQVFGSRSDALLSDYAQGLEKGYRIASELRYWMGESQRSVMSVNQKCVTSG